MANQYREKLQLWVRETLGDLGGEGNINQIAKHIWEKHENDLRQGGDVFYSWQYDMRWAAQQLRSKGFLGLRTEGSKSIWTLKK